MQIPKESPTLALDEKVKKLTNEGKSIINLTIGEPHFNTPKNICDASIRAIKEGFTHYTPSAGIPKLRETIAKHFSKKYKTTYKKEEVFVGAGTKFILFSAFQILSKKGDEVLLASPTWSTYVEQIKMSGAKPVLIHLKSPFKLTAKEVEKKITNKTKLIVLNSPSNPTGAVIEKEELLKISKLALKKKIFVISDEIYDQIIYEKTHTSIASFDKNIRENTLVINGFSKSYAMTGWRLGYACGPEWLIKNLSHLASQITSGVNSISQIAGIEAIEGNQKEIKKMVTFFKQNRDLAFNFLNKIKEIKVTKPEGAFYIFLDISQLLNKKYKNSTSWAEGLLEKEGVAVVPGEAFYAPNFVRISYATLPENLKKGLIKINKFINENK